MARQRASVSGTFARTFRGASSRAGHPPSVRVPSDFRHMRPDGTAGRQSASSFATHIRRSGRNGPTRSFRTPTSKGPLVVPDPTNAAGLIADHVAAQSWPHRAHEVRDRPGLIFRQWMRIPPHGLSRRDSLSAPVAAGRRSGPSAPTCRPSESREDAAGSVPSTTPTPGPSCCRHREPPSSRTKTTAKPSSP